MIVNFNSTPQRKRRRFIDPVRYRLATLLGIPATIPRRDWLA